MRRYRIHSLISVILIIGIILTGCGGPISHTSEDYASGLRVHFIDVGQGDSTFIEFPNGKTSLIDAGTRGAGDRVVEYINDLGIDKIDYLIATHPHEDHIGGLPEVIRNFDVNRVYMPEKTTNTLIFEELLLELENKDLTIHLAKGGDVIIDGGKLKYSILAPNTDNYSGLNDFSIVTKIEYGYNSIIITGDAEKNSEREMVELGYDLAADVLRIGHHGGKTSSMEEFLIAVDPDYSIISVGKGNTYGHPHRETLNRLQKIDSQIMRTDELGDIILISDGKELKWEENLGAGDSIKGQYIGNQNTKVFHHMNCKSLPKEGNRIIFESIEEAKQRGYRPHKVCIKEGGN
ncbi:MAG: MBL fold metallo-hydrolase [Tissierellia bacterium]|nr:MBL fold metallo-hydrolase [Tissierellia bacterium]